ncbi:hypothetical protein I4U23_011295 [Adineta vaga]|nr:hypothetical protein I4U23_011295 [Adineta vaga]
MPTSYDFDYLPENVLALSGYDFFQFIKSTLGEPEANLLQKISVKTTSSLLLTENPFDIFNCDIDDDELTTLKNQLSFKLKNDKYMIKPGVIAGFRSLNDALKRRVDEQATKSKRKKKQQSQQLSHTNSSFICSLPSTSPPSAPTQSVPHRFSLAEHRAHIVKLIEKWCSDNKENFGLEIFTLEEDVDFNLFIDSDGDADVKANIKCKCNKLISLGKNDNRIQVSNYYKHLQSNGCDYMKNIKKAAKDAQLEQQQQQSSSCIILSSHLSNAPVIQDDVSPLTTQATANTDSKTLTNQHSSGGGKRRLASQSQKDISTKRRRT